jgi:hypothetical protein
MPQGRRGVTALSDRTGRVVVSIGVALAAAAIAAILATRPAVHQDFEFYWRAAALWLRGIDPYTLRPGQRDWPLPDPFFYPLPAVLALAPLAWLPQAVAVAIFVGVPAGFLAWRLSSQAFWPLLLLASPSFVMAVVLGQWSPWLTLGLFSPAAGVMLAAKPSIGLACWIARPSGRAALAATAIVACSLALAPSWPIGWLRVVGTLSGHSPPILSPLGFLCLPLLVRWRDPDARLLVAMTCVPQLLFFADQLPLLTIARTRREAVFLCVSGWLVALLWFVRDSAHAGSVWFAEPYVLVGCYLPALWLTLRRLDVRRGRRPTDVANP